MRVFHGSDTWIEKIDLMKGKSFPDFGRGFYVTKIRGHAHRRAVSTAIANGTVPIIIEYEYEEAYPINMHLVVKTFHEMTEEWVNFVMMNRNRNILQPSHSYDIVEGPVADDWVTFQLARFRKRKITVSALIEKLKYREQTHQICFCTPESLWSLELIEDETHFDREDLCSLIIENIEKDYQMTNFEATRTLYSSNVFVTLSEKDAKLYEKTWQEIYQILKKEISNK